jgi:hypothetical protein
MAARGVGNFDGDTAADHLSILTGRPIAEIADAMAGDPVEIEPDEYRGVAVPCNVELLHLVARSGYAGAQLPRPHVVEEWKRAYLSVRERTVDDLEPTPEFRTARRAVLVRTFDQPARAAAAKEHVAG